MTQDLLAVLIAFAAGISGGVWGIGGGWIVMPVLMLIGVPFNVAIGCSIFHMAVKSVYPVYSDSRKNNLFSGEMTRSIIVPMTIGSVLAVFGGVWLLSVIKKTGPRADLIIAVSYILMLGFIAGYGLCERFSRCDAGKEVKLLRKSHVLSFITGGISGFVAGLLGIGGGFIQRPALTYVIRTKEEDTRPIAQFIVLVTSVVGVLPHFLDDNIILKLALLLSAGGIVGQIIGMKIHALYVKAGLHDSPALMYVVTALCLMVAQLFKIFHLPVYAQGAAVFTGIIITAWIIILALKALRR